MSKFVPNILQKKLFSFLCIADRKPFLTESRRKNSKGSDVEIGETRKLNLLGWTNVYETAYSRMFSSYRGYTVAFHGTEKPPLSCC